MGVRVKVGFQDSVGVQMGGGVAFEGGGVAKCEGLPKIGHFEKGGGVTPFARN